MENKSLDEMQIEVIKADAVMTFVNTILGAYSTGFIKEHEMNLVQLHECARSHIEQNYSVSMPKLHEKWSEDCIEAFRNGFK